MLSVLYYDLASPYVYLAVARAVYEREFAHGEDVSGVEALEARTCGW